MISKKTLLALAAATAAVALPMAAQADVTANVALTTKYKFRGQDQSDPTKVSVMAIQGGFDYAHSSGFYIGNWNSSIGFAGGTEVDVYGGYAGTAGSLGYDVGALQYYYPGDTTANTTELYGKLSFGPASLKYSHVVSSKWFGVAGGRNSGYLELNGSYDVGGGISLVGHLGSTRFSSDAKATGSVWNYTDYKLGASMGLGAGFTGELAYAGGNKDGAGQWGDVNKGKVILTLSKSL